MNLSKLYRNIAIALMWFFGLILINLTINTEVFSYETYLNIVLIWSTPYMVYIYKFND